MDCVHPVPNQNSLARFLYRVWEQTGCPVSDLSREIIWHSVSKCFSCVIFQKVFSPRGHLESTKSWSVTFRFFRSQSMKCFHLFVLNAKNNTCVSFTEGDFLKIICWITVIHYSFNCPLYGKVLKKRNDWRFSFFLQNILTCNFNFKNVFFFGIFLHFCSRKILVRLRPPSAQ